MATDTNLNQLIINKLTQEQYKAAKEAGQIVETEMYMITDDDEGIEVDTEVVEGSENAVSGGAVYDYVGNVIAAIPTPDVSEQISTHNSDGSAHTDIRTLANNAQAAAESAASAAANAQTAAASKAPMYDYGTTDLEAGVSALEHGKLYFVYE